MHTNLCESVTSVNSSLLLSKQLHKALCKVGGRFNWPHAYEREGANFAIVTVGYFTKWAEQNHLSKLLNKKLSISN